MAKNKKRLSIFLATALVLSQFSVVSANEEISLDEENAVNEELPVINQELDSTINETQPTESTEQPPNEAEEITVPTEEDGGTSEPSEPSDVEPLPELEPEISPYTNGNGKVIKTTPYYFVSSGVFKEVGTLEEGVVITPTRVTTNYLIVKAGSKYFYIPRDAFTSTDEKSNLEAHIQGSFPRTIVAEKDSPITDKAGNSIGTIVKGEQVKLHMVTGGRGVIELLGKRVYVDLSNFQHLDQVMPKKNITYKEMEYYLKVFSYMYPEFTELVKIGTSVQGRTLYALKVGTGKKEILMDASMHAREHMTTNVLLEMIDQYTYHYVKGTKFNGYQVKTLLDQVSIWFVPMMNPDGVTLVQTKENASASTKKLNNGNTNYNRWKANIRGVDLNRNFDGGWATKATAKAPSYKNYKGTKAFSEPESQALRNFVAKHKFKSYISYHSSGSVLYYYHHQKGTQLTRDLSVAKMISKVTGYRVLPPTGETGSGASTDWFIMNYKMPGITVEIAPAVGETVVSLKYWDSVWKKHQTIGLLAANEANKR